MNFVYAMRMFLPLVILLPSCSMTSCSMNEQPKDTTLRTTAAAEAAFPYMAVRKMRGPALEALMYGRLEVQDDCLVFVEPGGTPRLAVFHPPALLKRNADGSLAVAGDGSQILIGREVRVGGGLLAFSDYLRATLRAPVPDRCPSEAVEIGEFVNSH